ncbi:hypothetical protein COOONC_11391 [Cooperia oncophora]
MVLSRMSNAVPDPDDVMEADYQNHVADEPLDDFDIDVGNANLEEELQIDKSFQNREGTPVPEGLLAAIRQPISKLPSNSSTSVTMALSLENEALIFNRRKMVIKTFRTIYI